MRALLLIAVFLAGCATAQAPPPEPEQQSAPGEVPMVRLIGLSSHVEQEKIGYSFSRKEKRFTPPQVQQLDMLMKLADDALESARRSYFIGDFDSFERSMSAVDQILHEFRSHASDFESERKMMEAERAYSRSQAKPKPKPKPKEKQR